MAKTTFPANDPLAVKIWSKMLFTHVQTHLDIASLMGDSADSIIQVKSELAKGSGDRITFGLRARLNGPGFTNAQTAEGNGEALSFYDDYLIINELGHVVSPSSPYSIDAQRVPYDLRMEAKDALAEWWAERISRSFFNQVCGITIETDLRYTGLNPTIAPSSDRWLLAGGASNEQSLTTAGTHGMTLPLLDDVVSKIKSATHEIRPIYVDGKKVWVCYLHPYQVKQLRAGSSAGQWLDIQKAAMTGGMTTSNPIFTGSLGMYNGIVLRESRDVPNGFHSGTGAVLPDVRRAVILGAQAASCAYGSKVGTATRVRWTENVTDHERRLEVGAWKIWGMKKNVFNNSDFGTFVLSTYSPA